MTEHLPMLLLSMYRGLALSVPLLLSLSASAYKPKNTSANSRLDLYGYDLSVCMMSYLLLLMLI